MSRCTNGDISSSYVHFFFYPIFFVLAIFPFIYILFYPFFLCFYLFFYSFLICFTYFRSFINFSMFYLFFNSFLFCFIHFSMRMTPSDSFIIKPSDGIFLWMNKRWMTKYKILLLKNMKKTKIHPIF